MEAARDRRRTFLLTWVAYASYYLLRKPFAIAKATLADQFGLSLAVLAVVDTGYLVGYALGQFASGLVCDRIGARRLLGIGMLAVAGAGVVFGAGNGALIFIIAFAASGVFQSTGWPGTIKAMAPLYRPSERGKAMGLWSTCYQVGGLVSTALATRLLSLSGWRISFFVPAAWIAAVGLAILLWLPDGAKESGREERRRQTGRVLGTPLLWNLGLAYFGLKLIRYSLLFWLPLYLHRQLGYSQTRAGYTSLSFELGGVVGAVAAGALSDRLGRRGPVLLVMTMLLALALVLYIKVGALGTAFNFCAMALVGFLLFGPDAILSSAAAQDIGGVAAAGVAAGVINGIGSLGAIAQGALTALVVGRYGWQALFQVFVALALVSAAILVPYARHPAPPPLRPS